MYLLFAAVEPVVTLAVCLLGGRVVLSWSDRVCLEMSRWTAGSVARGVTHI